MPNNPLARSAPVTALPQSADRPEGIPVIPQSVWHGNLLEKAALLAALDHNCGCEMDETTGVRVLSCTAHQMLIRDQRALDGLLFMRRGAQRLLAQEFAPQTPTEPRPYYPGFRPRS